MCCNSVIRGKFCALTGRTVFARTVPDGSHGTIQQWKNSQMASVAELESGLTRERKLAEARKRVARVLRGKQVGNARAVAKIKENANQHAENLRVIVQEIKAKGIVSVLDIAEELNRLEVRTPRGGSWHSTSVFRLLGRLDLPAFWKRLEADANPNQRRGRA
jgi:hypothetical protein